MESEYSKLPRLTPFQKLKALKLAQNRAALAGSLEAIRNSHELLLSGEAVIANIKLNLPRKLIATTTPDLRMLEMHSRNGTSRNQIHLTSPNPSIETLTPATQSMPLLYKPRDASKNKFWQESKVPKRRHIATLPLKLQAVKSFPLIEDLLESAMSNASPQIKVQQPIKKIKIGSKHRNLLRATQKLAKIHSNLNLDLVPPEKQSLQSVQSNGSKNPP